MWQVLDGTHCIPFLKIHDIKLHFLFTSLFTQQNRLISVESFVENNFVRMLLSVFRQCEYLIKKYIIHVQKSTQSVIYWYYSIANSKYNKTVHVCWVVTWHNLLVHNNIARVVIQMFNGRCNLCIYRLLIECKRNSF